jgi:hypothetical protein
MGLDSVEIVLRAEELFGIDIADDEAGSISTVGDFYEVIRTKLEITPSRDPVTPDELPGISQREGVSVPQPIQTTTGPGRSSTMVGAKRLELPSRHFC